MPGMVSMAPIAGPFDLPCCSGLKLAKRFDSSVPCGLALSSWNYFLGVVPHPPGDETLARRLALARLDSPDLGW